MNIYTDDEALLELMESGKTCDRRYKKLPKEAVYGFLKAIKYLKLAGRIEDLYKFKGLNYEVLSGNYKGYESVRCNVVWRLIFKSYAQEGSIIVTEICLMKISHHYE